MNEAASHPGRGMHPHPAHSARASADPMRASATRTWPIADMVSTGCARALEKAVAALPGVDEATANFATGELTVRYRRGTLAPGAVAELIRRCGFTCSAAGGCDGAEAAHATH